MAKANQTAIIWEPDVHGPVPSDKRITYSHLHEEVCRLANVLKNLGVRKGDRVTIYLPMIPEAVFAMLACARIGAVHSVVFAGFSPDALARAASTIATAASSSPPTKAAAAARPCR
jgi:acetyl-CoA synthetase